VSLRSISPRTDRVHVIPALRRSSIQRLFTAASLFLREARHQVRAYALEDGCFSPRLLVAAKLHLSNDQRRMRPRLIRIVRKVKLEKSNCLLITAHQNVHQPYELRQRRRAPVTGQLLSDPQSPIDDDVTRFKQLAAGLKLLNPTSQKTIVRSPLALSLV